MPPDFKNATSPPIPVDDPDARLGGNDESERVLLEDLHVEAEKVKAKKTSYQVEVLVAGGSVDDEHWNVVGNYEASSAREAIRMCVMGGYYDIGDGETMRAIPKRNITQLELAVTMTSKLNFS